MLQHRRTELPEFGGKPRQRDKALQRPASPDFSVDAPQLPRRGDGHLACGGRSRL